MKVILFDIDQTLIARGWGIHGNAFDFAFKTVYGLAGASIKQIKVSGMIDPEIFITIAVLNGMDQDRAKELVPEGVKAMAAYCKDHGNERDLKLMPGVIQLLDTLKKTDHVLGLLTGNVEEVAWIKLEKAGIADCFSFGSFGNMAAKRADLVEIARAKAEQFLGKPVSLNELVIVGDSPRDIECAKATGIKCIAVGAGSFSYEELSVFKPDLTLHSLEEIPQFMDFLNV